MLEVEKLKMELARQGVDISNATLKRGIMIPNREERYTEPGGYTSNGDFLMKNPFKVKKKRKTKKGGESPLRRRGKMGKSKSPTKKTTS